MKKDLDFQKTLEDSFLLYAGYVAQQRAIPSVEDGLKYSARQALFTQQYTGNVNSKPFQKGATPVGQALSLFYDHGDQAIYDTMVRMAKPWALRYPLEEADGSVGTISNPTDHASMRYLSIRLSSLGDEMFESIKKNTIDEWREGHDPKDKFPMLLPSKGFYNIVNGAAGIGVGLASSIPQFNLVEVNNALIKILKHGKDVKWEDIYCPPDFATGATIINGKEVEESLRVGHGKACKIRATIEYDSKDNTLIVSEIPYSVYTDTIMSQITEMIDADPKCGISKVVDGSKTTPNIIIYLTKNANPSRITQNLYKQTSLQYFYGINMTMLEGNRRPRIFGWRECLEAFIRHSRYVKFKEIEFDYNKAKDRLEIVEGLLIAIANIEEVVKIIKASSSSAVAGQELKNKFGFSDRQVEAIMEMKLQRLANLEAKKLQNEALDLKNTCERLWKLMHDQVAMDVEIVKDLERVKSQYGDKRRTNIVNMTFNENDEPIEKKVLTVFFTEKGAIQAHEVDQYALQSRGGKGAKIKLREGDFIKETVYADNGSWVLIFTSLGKAHTYYLNNLDVGVETHIQTILDLEPDEEVLAILPYNKAKSYDSVILATKNGNLKKSSVDEYITKSKKPVMAIKLREGDSIASVAFVTKGDELLVASRKGNCIRIDESSVPTTGRATMGVQGIKLDDGNSVLNIVPITKETKEICSISTSGLVKRTKVDEFVQSNRATKGVKLHNLKEDEEVAAVVGISNQKEIMAISLTNAIRISLEQVPQSSRNTLGVSVMKGPQKITKIVLINN